MFLGANQDSYAAGAGLGMHHGNVSNFSPTPDGVRATYDGLARTVTGWRGKGRAAATPRPGRLLGRHQGGRGRRPLTSRADLAHGR